MLFEIHICHYPQQEEKICDQILLCKISHTFFKIWRQAQHNTTVAAMKYKESELKI
jgi:hypothetical protein